jgi:hypothetical protein
VPLREHQGDEVLEVAETCQMALQRIQVGYSGSGCHHLAQVHVSKVQWLQVCLKKEQLTCLVSMPMPAVTSVPARAPRCHQRGVALLLSRPSTCTPSQHTHSRAHSHLARREEAHV